MSTSQSPITFPQMRKVHDLLSKKGVESPHLQAGLLETGILSDLAEVVATGMIPDREKIRNALGMEPLKLEFPVDYSATIDTLIEHAKFDSVGRNFGWHRFPRKTEPNRIVTARLVPIHFSRSDDLTAEEKLLRAIFDKGEIHGTEGFVNAGIEELLAFAKHFPATQRRISVCATGSIAESRGHKHIACLCEHYGYPMQWHKPAGRALAIVRFDEGARFQNWVYRLIIGKQSEENPEIPPVA